MPSSERGREKEKVAICYLAVATEEWPSTADHSGFSRSFDYSARAILSEIAIYPAEF